jgi:Zn-dependent M28 family amino/carboxypeptidase
MIKRSVVALIYILFLIDPSSRYASLAASPIAIQPEVLMRHIEYLASEELQGRYPGTEGSRKAMAYIKEKFKEYGLSPVTLPGPGFKPVPTYEQTFSIKTQDLEEFHLTFKKHRAQSKEHGVNSKSPIQNPGLRTVDGVPLIFSPEGSYHLEGIFAGYGMVTPEYDDYEGLMVKNKAVLILEEVPNFLRNYARRRGFIPLLFDRVKVAQEHGAKALILYVEANLDTYVPYIMYPSQLPERTADEIARARREPDFISLEMELSKIVSNAEKPSFEITIPVIFVPYYPADKPDWLEGGRTFSELRNCVEVQEVANARQEANRDDRVFPSAHRTSCSRLVEGVTLDLEIKYAFQEIKTGNILGFLPGQDTRLGSSISTPARDDRSAVPPLPGLSEVIVLGAHYDHLGVNPQGETFLGADDNASGIAALLEIAKALSAPCKRGGIVTCPYKRGVLFIAFGAEEWGLLGSRFYVEHPVVPNDKVVAMLNIDSISKGKPREIHLVGSSIYPELASISRQHLNRLGLLEGPDIDRKAFYNGTDHYPFHLKGIPTMEYFASSFDELHTLQDTIAQVQPEKVVQVAQVVFLTALELLTISKRPF